VTNATQAPSVFVELPIVEPHRTRCAPLRKSRRSIYRAAVLIAVHLAIAAHFLHWKVAGRTVTPVEPSEAMFTLEGGQVNAGFVLFGILILSTLVLGRFFCGWACHLVAYQDLCQWLLKKIGLRPRPVRSRLLVAVPFAAAFYMFAWPQVLRLFEGREFPPIVWHLSTTNFWKTFPGPIVGALTFLVCGFLLVYLLGAKGFCTYGCPYGAFFAAADRFAPGRIRVTDACEGCGHCTATCTSGVRVHEEVARHDMVVDTRCMKCMDCVNVCPKGALYYGFGKIPALGRKPQRARRWRTYDFTWSEEIAMAIAFLAGLVVFRQLYHGVPFLFAIGLGVLTATSTVAAWRLARRRDFSFQHHRLRHEGRFTPAGAVAALLLLAFFAFLGHSAVVQYHVKEGTRLLARAGMIPPGERAETVAASLVHLQKAETLGLLPDGPLQHMIGSIARDRGDFEEAERCMRRAIEIEPRLTVPRFEIGRILVEQRRDFAGAERVVREVLEVDPHHLEAEARLADVLIAQGKFAEAEAVLVECLGHDPDYHGATYRLEALRAFLREAPGETPR
jgi:polyferredoxin